MTGAWRLAHGTSVGLVALSLLTAGPTTSAQSQAPRPQFREGVDLGHVDVTVLDGKRHAVRGLTAADFTLKIDGKTRPIRAFAAVDVPSPPSELMTLAPWTRDVAPDVQTNTTSEEGRLVVIFWDRSIPPGPKMEVAKRIARAAINELGPNDLAAITAVRSRPVQNFTADRARLLRAIDNANPGSAPGDDFRVNFLPDPVFDAHEACYCNACILEQIRDIASALRPVPRPKVILFIGSQLTMDVRDVVVLDPRFGLMSPLAAECSLPIKRARETMMRALDVANVTIHTLDPSGLESGSAGSAASSLRGPAAQLLATQTMTLSAAFHAQIRVLPDRTGGRVVTNTNTPETFVPAVFAETASYYVLGFDVPTGFDGPEKVDVKVNRSGTKVHVQRAFAPPASAPTLARTAETGSQAQVRAAEEALQLTPAGFATRAIEAVLPARGIPMTATALPFRVRDSDEAAVIIVSGLYPPSSDARRVPARFELLVGALDPRARSKAETRVAVEIGSDAPRGYDVVSRLSLKPGSYEIRSGAAAADGRAGSVVTYVDVPDFRKEPLSLSGLALTVVPAGASTAVGGASEVVPFMPTARRMFAPADTIRSYVKIYQGESDAIVPVQLDVRILDTRGRAMLDAGATLDVGRWHADRSTEFGLDMPLSALAPGEYLLTIAAAEGKHTARRDVRFVVAVP